MIEKVKARAVKAACVVFCASILALFGAPTKAALASTTDGTIDPNSQNYKYGWGNYIGWVNFGTSGGNIHVTDTKITGYAWSQNYGWINMSSTRAAVTNNGEGTLGGYAWGENIGYISFTGVTISSSGRFSGTATTQASSTFGRISFDCATCRVETDWRPASTRGSGGSGGGGGGGGGGGPPLDAFEKPKEPLAVVINNGAIYTNSPLVNLSLFAGSNVVSMALSNYLDFSLVGQEPYATAKQWNLCRGATGQLAGDCPEGTYIVYAKYYTAWGQTVDPVYDTIIYKKSLTPTEQELHEQLPTSTATISSQTSLFNFIKKTIDFFTPEFLRRKPTPVVTPIVIPKESPLALRGPWELLPKPAIQRYVFSPLSQRVYALSHQLPTLTALFNAQNITGVATLPKLRGVDLVLPGLSKTIALKIPSLSGGQVNSGGALGSTALQTPAFSKPGTLYNSLTPAKLPSFAGIPVVALDKSLKDKIPKEVVFARGGQQTVDLDVAVHLDERGNLQQTIKTIAGQRLDLFVRPIAPAASVTGYMVLRSRATAAADQQTPKAPNNYQFSLASLPDSLVFANPLFGSPTSPKKAQELLATSFDAATLARLNLPADIDQKFLLQSFAYTDPDGDGIFEAHVQAPVVDGSYDVLTLISYKDADLGTRQIALTAVVDPEGYVYELVSGKEVRIPQAVVSLYGFNPDTGVYELWDAQNYAQQNPQVTDKRGSYAFLVPPGSYYTTVKADGYNQYRGDVFEVRAGDSGIHTNIALSPITSWRTWLDWRTGLLLIMLLVGIWHVYRERLWKGEQGVKKEHDSPNKPLLPPLP